MSCLNLKIWKARLWLLTKAMIRRLALLIAEGLISQRLQIVIIGITYGALIVRNLNIHGKNVGNFMGNSFKEDKERDSYFFDQFLIDPPKVTSPVPVPFASPFASELESAPIDLVTELKLSPTKPAENRMTGKAYSRKKAAIPRLIQVQESKSASRNEVTVSPPPLQTEYELLIAIRKGMRECTKYPLHPLSHVSIKNCLGPIRVFFQVEQYPYSYYSIQGFI
ncbi:hypothetical protein CK203_023148 [Vitis vinifera]|uniref:Uncharacterized protein n=1 Tax=Vitis vinifera TaxID=29760 RepID=A0A438J1V2_VITVI|nr:hypothetical protein CK203_023148 [Vitis vinifera]